MGPRFPKYSLFVLGSLCALLFAAWAQSGDPAAVRFVGKTTYLNNAHAVVAYTIDDSTKLVPQAIDTMDKYGIKGTIFVSTDDDPPPEERFFTQNQIWMLWDRLRKAIDDGHEIGSHASTHPCGRPESEDFCRAAYTDEEVIGSRDEILK